MTRKCLLILFLTLASWQLVTLDILTTSTQFNDYLSILENGNNIEKIRIADAVWAQIRADYPKDIEKTTILYTLLTYIIQSKRIGEEEQQTAAELQQEVRQALVLWNAQLLARALNGPGILKTQEMDAFYANLIKNYEPFMSQKIFESAIDEMYNFKTLDSLAKNLQQTYQKGSKRRYDLTLSAQMYLYWKFVNRGDINDEYIFNVAYYLKQLQSDDFYRSLDATDKRRIKRAVDSLPSSLQFLLFQPYFCLLNKAYEEYIYTTNAIDIDEKRRYDLTWRPAWNVGDNGRWIVNYTEVTEYTDSSNASKLDLRFALQSQLLNMYLYLEREITDLNNLIAAWRPGTAPKTSAWSVQLIENQLVFHQEDGFVMCTSDHVRDSNRRYVYGFSDQEHKKDRDNCQWIARACP